VRLWWNRFGPMFAADIRRQRVSRMKGFRHWRWHLDEMYVKLNGEMVYLWRAVDHEGEILESYITKKRDKSAALVFLKKALKRHGRAEEIVTDGLRSYPAAMRELGNLDRREMGRWLNNRAENSHLPFRRRERAMLRFRQMKSLQKFASVHANVHTTLTSNAISLIARPIRPAARPPWLSGRTSWPEPGHGWGELCQSETSCDWTDTTPGDLAGNPAIDVLVISNTQT
jgi:putative transposase